MRVKRHDSTIEKIVFATKAASNRERDLRMKRLRNSEKRQKVKKNEKKMNRDGCDWHVL